MTATDIRGAVVGVGEMLHLARPGAAGRSACGLALPAPYMVSGPTWVTCAPCAAVNAKALAAEDAAAIASARRDTQ